MINLNTSELQAIRQQFRQRAEEQRAALKNAPQLAKAKAKKEKK